MANLDKSQEQITRSIGQRVAAGEREIARRYASTLNGIRGLLSDIYGKYESGGILTFSDMAKFDRLQKFLQEVSFIFKTNYADLEKIITDILGFSFETAWNLTAWAIETDAKVKMGWTTAAPEAITKSINNPVSGMKLNERLKMHRQQIVWTIQQEVTQGLVIGSTYKQMADRIKPALDFDATKAIRVARTESHRVQEDAKHEVANHATKQGVIMDKTWMNMHDARVRQSPRANHRMGGPLAGKTLPADGIFIGLSGRGPAPGQLGSAAENVNCRCILKWSIADIRKTQYNDVETVTFDKWRQMHQP